MQPFLMGQDKCWVGHFSMKTEEPLSYSGTETFSGEQIDMQESKTLCMQQQCLPHRLSWLKAVGSQRLHKTPSCHVSSGLEQRFICSRSMWASLPQECERKEKSALLAEMSDM